MAGTKEIKTHIESVRETRKITNAMYLIASTKLRRARQELDNTRPYFEALRGEIKRIFRTVKTVDSRYFYPVGDDTPREGTYGCLVITEIKSIAPSKFVIVRCAWNQFLKASSAVFPTPIDVYRRLGRNG